MKRLRLILILTYFSIVGMAQDAQFSQFYSSPLYLGPSLAGASGGGRVITNFRDQWPAIQSTYITYAFSADYYFSKYNSGVGLLMLRDQAGEGGLINQTNIGLQYSYNFPVSRNWSVRPGLSVYYYMKGIDLAELIFPDQIIRGGGTGAGGSVEDLPDLRVNHFDFTSSVLAYSDQYWIGFTFDHIMYFSSILANTQQYLPFRYSFYGGAKYNIVGRTRKVREESVTIAANYSSQYGLHYLDLGVYYTYEPIILGLWYRGIPVFPGSPNIGAVATSVGYKYNAWQIGYSFDFPVGALITQTGGAHEISLIYTFKERKRRSVRHKMVPCPVL